MKNKQYSSNIIIDKIMYHIGNNHKYQLINFIIITLLNASTNVYPIILPFLQVKPFILQSNSTNPCLLTWEICENSKKYSILYENSYQSLVLSYEIHCNRQLTLLFGLLFFIGLVFGSYLTHFINDKYGRRRTIIFFSIVYIIFNLLYLINSKILLFIIVFTKGMSSSILIITSNLHISELMKRSLLSICFSIINSSHFLLGIIYSYLFYLLIDWKVIVLINLVFHMIVLLVFMFYIQDSPKYFLMKKDMYNFRKSIIRIAYMNNKEIDGINEEDIEMLSVGKKTDNDNSNHSNHNHSNHNHSNHSNSLNSSCLYSINEDEDPDLILSQSITSSYDNLKNNKIYKDNDKDNDNISNIIRQTNRNISSKSLKKVEEFMSKRMSSNVNSTINYNFSINNYEKEEKNQIFQSKTHKFNKENKKNKENNENQSQAKETNQNHIQNNKKHHKNHKNHKESTYTFILFLKISSQRTTFLKLCFLNIIFSLLYFTNLLSVKFSDKIYFDCIIMLTIDIFSFISIGFIANSMMFGRKITLIVIIIVAFISNFLVIVYFLITNVLFHEVIKFISRGTSVGVILLINTISNEAFSVSVRSLATSYIQFIGRLFLITVPVIVEYLVYDLTFYSIQLGFYIVCIVITISMNESYGQIIPEIDPLEKVDEDEDDFDEE